MKKICICLLAILLCLPVFAGCAKKEKDVYQGRVTVENITKKETEDRGVWIVLTSPVQAEILAILNGGEWVDGTYDCGYHFALTVSETKLQYQPHMGVFHDVTHNKVLILTPEERETINQRLGAVAGKLGYENIVKIIRYNENGFGVTEKTIFGCALANSIVETLSGMSENGIVYDWISDTIVDEDATVLPIDEGTFWIEVGSKIYRLTPDMGEICLMESHLGMGYVLEMSKEEKAVLFSAWYYDPYNYYIGSYDLGKNDLQVEHVFKAPSTVEFSVLQVQAAEDANGTGKIVLEVTPCISQTLDMTLTCKQSDGTTASGDQKTLTLTAGQPQTVELTFGGSSQDYQLTIAADHTRLTLKIVVSE
jgi:hypothetical protein